MASQGTRGAVSTMVYFASLFTRPGDVCTVHTALYHSVSCMNKRRPSHQNSVTVTWPSLHACMYAVIIRRGLGGCRCKIHNYLCADCPWCRSPRQGVLIFNNDYHFRVHQISHCGPLIQINRTEASHQVDPRPGREVAMVTRAIPARRPPLAA